MARILRNGAGHVPAEHVGARGWVVRGVRFANSAAKFWASLVDELAADYPKSDAVALHAFTDIQLDRELLFPENALQHELDKRQCQLNIKEALQEALAQFDLIGPPGAVHVRVYAGGREIHTCDLPLDCVDADIFPCLLVWLLEWAEVPQCLWNNPEVSSEFSARELVRRARGHAREVRYRLSIELVSEHVSEGLYQRTLTLRYARQG